MAWRRGAGVGVCVAASLASLACAYDAAWRLGLVAATWVQLGAVLLLWRWGGVSLGVFWVIAVALRLTWLPLPPLLSDDLFRYAWDGLVQMEGWSPYALRPADPALSDLQATPFYEGMNSETYYSVYPPVSQYVFRLGASFYESFGAEGVFLVIKAAFTAMELGAVALLVRLAGARQAMLYAWHPLAVLEVAGQGHTEAAMVLGLVVAVWAVHRGKAGWAGGAVASATLAKLYPLLLAPLLLWRPGRWRALGAGLLVGLVLAAPYVSGEAIGHAATSLRLYGYHFEFNAGPYLLLKEAVRLITGDNWSIVIGPLLQTTLLLGILPLIYKHDHDAVKGDGSHFARSSLLVLGAMLFFATTVHPWYLLGPLVLAPLASATPAWHWHALSAGSLGTYAFYSHDLYVPFVVLGWLGFVILGLWRHGDTLLQRLQRRRAEAKADALQPFLPEPTKRLLDLGAGEGYVAEAVSQRLDAEAQLADVVDYHRADWPFVLLQDTALPFEDDVFDVTLLVFVLHHAEDPRRLVREALRVTRARVLVLETVYTSDLQRRRLRVLDRLANRLRSGGRMDEEHLAFRTATAWRDLIREEGGQVLAVRHLGSRFHPQVLYSVKPASDV